MAKHQIRITQTSRVERSIVIEVEADTIEDAIEAQSMDEAPSFHDTRWMIVSNDLENEQVQAA